MSQSLFSFIAISVPIQVYYAIETMDMKLPPNQWQCTTRITHCSDKTNDALFLLLLYCLTSCFANLLTCREVILMSEHIAASDSVDSQTIKQILKDLIK